MRISLKPLGENFIVGLFTGRLQHLLFWSVILTALSSHLHAQTSTTEPAAETKQPEFDAETQLQSFDEVWQRIKDTHWDPDMVGDSWDQARDELRPKIKESRSLNEVREILGELVNRLEQSHFGIIPASAYGMLEEQGGAKDHDAGIRIRRSTDGLVVTQVRPQSPAESFGVQPGWIVEKIDDRTGQEILEVAGKAAHGPMRQETIVGMIGKRLTSGPQGETIHFEFRDHQNQSRAIKLSLAATPGQPSKLGNLPAMRVHQIAKTLDGNIGYYWFNAFLDPVRIMKQYNATVRNPEHSKGLIIDLRDNVGGIAAMTMGMASQFATAASPLGTMSMKGAKMNFTLSARPNPITVPVAILVDECSISSAEIFAGGMQDLGLARVFGARTAGLALPSVVSKLPNGDGFQYAIADYHSASGRSLEADGVIPDEEIPVHRDSLKTLGDPVLARAIEWIETQPSDTKK